MDEDAAELARRRHREGLHEGWATPLSVVADLIADATPAAIVDIRRVVAGEQNEVYDVTLERVPSLIVKISHRGPAAHEREAWVLGQCAARGVAAPRLHGRRRIEVGSESRSVIVMDKLPGTPLGDVDDDELDVRQVLTEVGAWLTDLHSIPAQGLGYVDGSGAGNHASMDEWLAGLTADTQAFEDAGRSVGLDATTVRAWLREIVESCRESPPLVTLIHNDLLPGHILVHDGRLSGIIDFGEVAAEPAANDFAKWDFQVGERWPVEWLRAGYGNTSLFTPPNHRTYRALWLANGLWNMRWYHETGFPAGVGAARDRLLREAGP